VHDDSWVRLAAKPMIVRDTIICDRHQVLLSEASLRACHTGRQ
jgi:hypothetical protein